jgi:hypothetical protein
VCETSLALPWERVQDLLINPLLPKNKPEPETLKSLVKNWSYGPSEVRGVDGTPLTGAELEIRKAQIKSALERLLAREFFPALRDDISPSVFQRVQKQLEPNLYVRITRSVYNELRRSGHSNITKKLLKEEVSRECERLNVADLTLNLRVPPPHFGKILKATAAHRST